MSYGSDRLPCPSQISLVAMEARALSVRRLPVYPEPQCSRRSGGDNPCTLPQCLAMVELTLVGWKDPVVLDLPTTDESFNLPSNCPRTYHRKRITLCYNRCSVEKCVRQVKAVILSVITGLGVTKGHRWQGECVSDCRRGRAGLKIDHPL